MAGSPTVIVARNTFIVILVSLLICLTYYLLRFNPKFAPFTFNSQACHCSSNGADSSSSWAHIHTKLFQPIPEFERPSDTSLLDNATTSPLFEEIMLPPGGEFLRVTGEDRWYGVSMLHQLHCLHMLKAVLFNEGMHSLDSPRKSLENGRGDEGMGMEEGHWTHCLSYIAQVSGNLHSVMTYTCHYYDLYLVRRESFIR